MISVFKIDDSQTHVTVLFRIATLCSVVCYVHVKMLLFTQAVRFISNHFSPENVLG